MSENKRRLVFRFSLRVSEGKKSNENHFYFNYGIYASASLIKSESQDQ